MPVLPFAKPIKDEPPPVEEAYVEVHWFFEHVPPEKSKWACLCGNSLFNITPTGTFCPNCGEYQKF